MRTDSAGDRPGRVAVIINPRSGSTSRHRSADDRRAHALRLFEEHGLEATVWLTDRGGHAKELASRALDEGFRWVFAWGGDGTINEVAAGLVYSEAALSVIPSGSGNGLAREFGIPTDPARAIRAAIDGREMAIDAGEIDGRLFFNMAGVGFDAHVAHCFSTAVGGMRGAIPYFWTTAREALRYRPRPMTIEVNGETLTVQPILVSVANGRQWGSGAVVAPLARPDDGRLELVVVSGRRVASTLPRAWRLFTGSFHRSSAARTIGMESATIRSSEPFAVHVDGEPIGMRTSVDISVRPAALRFRAPRRRGP
jgi:diacylglycerol kinase (ATP)